MKLKLMIKKRSKKFSLIETDSQMSPAVRSDTFSLIPLKGKEEAKHSIDVPNDDEKTTDKETRDCNHEERGLQISERISFAIADPPDQPQSKGSENEIQLNQENIVYLQTVSSCENTNIQKTLLDPKHGSKVLASDLTTRSVKLSHVTGVMSSMLLGQSKKFWETSLLRIKDFISGKATKQRLTDIYIEAVEQGADTASFILTGNTISDDSTKHEEDLLNCMASLFDETANLTKDTVEMIKKVKNLLADDIADYLAQILSNSDSRVSSEDPNELYYSGAVERKSAENIEMIIASKSGSVIIKYGEQFNIVKIHAFDKKKDMSVSINNFRKACSKYK